jgi:hypothetical protein
VKSIVFRIDERIGLLRVSLVIEGLGESERIRKRLDLDGPSAVLGRPLGIGSVCSVPRMVVRIVIILPAGLDRRRSRLKLLTDTSESLSYAFPLEGGGLFRIDTGVVCRFC